VEKEVIKHGWASLSHQKRSQFPAYLFYVCIHDAERSRQITFIHPITFLVVWMYQAKIFLQDIIEISDVR
jgi:hypothetical protein